eukprot:scaffold13295_cov36-Cyclotella_meneghiniana.AAC.2
MAQEVFENFRDVLNGDLLVSEQACVPDKMDSGTPGCRRLALEAFEFLSIVPEHIRVVPDGLKDFTIPVDFQIQLYRMVSKIYYGLSLSEHITKVQGGAPSHPPIKQDISRRPSQPQHYYRATACVI